MGKEVKYDWKLQKEWKRRGYEDLWLLILSFSRSLSCWLTSQVSGRDGSYFHLTFSPLFLQAMSWRPPAWSNCFLSHPLSFYSSLAFSDSSISWLLWAREARIPKVIWLTVTTWQRVPGSASESLDCLESLTSTFLAQFLTKLKDQLRLWVCRMWGR